VFKIRIFQNPFLVHTYAITRFKTNFSPEFLVLWFGMGSNDANRTLLLYSCIPILKTWRGSSISNRSLSIAVATASVQCRVELHGVSIRWPALLRPDGVAARRPGGAPRLRPCPLRTPFVRMSRACAVWWDCWEPNYFLNSQIPLTFFPDSKSKPKTMLSYGY